MNAPARARASLGILDAVVGEMRDAPRSPIWLEDPRTIPRSRLPDLV